MKIAFATGLKAGGNLRDQSFSLDTLTVNVSDTVKVAVDAFVKKMGQGGFALNTRVEPMSIGRALVAGAARRARKMPPGLNVSAAAWTPRSTCPASCPRSKS